MFRKGDFSTLEPELDLVSGSCVWSFDGRNIWMLTRWNGAERGRRALAALPSRRARACVQPHACACHDMFPRAVPALYADPCVRSLTSHLSSAAAFLISEIMTHLYPVKYFDETPRRAALDDLEARLHRWLLNLPDALQYREGAGRAALPPHVVLLHIEYHAAMLLLHRAL